MKVFWTREALVKLEEIKLFISEDNPAVADIFIDEIISVAESLANFPERGRVVPELSIGTIREIFYKNYRIVYLIKKKSIDVLTLFESHRLFREDEISSQK